MSDIRKEDFFLKKTVFSASSKRFRDTYIIQRYPQTYTFDYKLLLGKLSFFKWPNVKKIILLSVHPVHIEEAYLGIMILIRACPFWEVLSTLKLIKNVLARLKKFVNY